MLQVRLHEQLAKATAMELRCYSKRVDADGAAALLVAHAGLLAVRSLPVLRDGHVLVGDDPLIRGRGNDMG